MMRMNTAEASAAMHRRLRDAMGELNVAAYSAAKAARIEAPDSPMAAELKAMALLSDKLLDSLP